MKGFVTFFLNINEYNKHITPEEYINIIRGQNQASVDALEKEGFISVFLACYDEACRVEKRMFIKEEQDIDDEENEKNVKSAKKKEKEKDE
jgi:hypothetical protein